MLSAFGKDEGDPRKQWMLQHCSSVPHYIATKTFVNSSPYYNKIRKYFDYFFISSVNLGYNET